MQRRYISIIFGFLLILSHITQTTSLNLIHEKGCQGCSVLSLDWFLRGGNNYLTSGGEDQTNNKQIRVALFDATQGTLVNKATASFGNVDSIINSLDEITIDGNTYIAAGGSTSNNNNQLIIYQFSGSKLINRAMIDVGATINTVSWLEAQGNYYLAIGGNENGTELSVYQFNPHNFHVTLLPDTVKNFVNGAVNSVDWLTNDGNYYLAVGGFETASIPNEIRIYQFDSVNHVLTLSISRSFLGNTVNDLKWFEYGNISYLATAGNDSMGDAQIRILAFNPVMNNMMSSLSLITSASFNDNNIAYAVDWLSFSDVIYLAVGGNAGDSGNGIQVFTFDGNNLTLATSANDAGADVRTLEWSVINSNAYLASGTTLRHPLRIFQLIS